MDHVMLLLYVSHEYQAIAEGRTYPQAMEPDVSILVVPTELEINISVVLKEVHLRYALAPM